jgi:hypothetical protein
MLQQGWLQHLLRCAAGQRFAGAQQQDAGKVSIHEVEIVHRGQNRDSLITEKVQQVHHFHLPADIQILCGLIQQQ